MNRKNLIVLLSSTILSCGICTFSTTYNVEAKEMKNVVYQNNFNNNYKFIEDLQNKSFSKIEEITNLKYLGEDEKNKFKDEIRQIINDFSENIKDIDSKENIAGINNFKREAIKKIYNVVSKAKEEVKKNKANDNKSREEKVEDILKSKEYRFLLKDIAYGERLSDKITIYTRNSLKVLNSTIEKAEKIIRQKEKLTLKLVQDTRDDVDKAIVDLVKKTN